MASSPAWAVLSAEKIPSRSTVFINTIMKPEINLYLGEVASTCLSPVSLA
jgi:hypothetical protein